MQLPQLVTICDVGPRDGLQTIATAISSADKVRLVDGLIAAGLPRVEAGAFVHPKVVPQMAESAAVFSGVRRVPGVRLRALVPNLVGAERAIAAGADEFCLVLLASETFQRKNVRASVAEALQEYAAVVALAVAHGVRVQADFDAAIGGLGGCPFAPKATGNICTEDLVHMLEAMGIATGIDLAALCDLGAWLQDGLGLQTPRLVAKAGPRSRRFPA